MKKYLFIALMLPLTGCFFAQDRLGRPDPNLKPYGAHWVKDGMTRESRSADWLQCGGGADLREGYEVKQGQSNKEFFDGFNAHTYQLLNCMKPKGYTYLDQCDARCLHP